jgi:hypothetical protein
MVGVQHNFSAREAVQWCMNALSGEFDHAAALQSLPSLIENHHVTGLGFRPMQAKGQHKILISSPWDADCEMIVNAFIKSIQDGHAQ